jgi:uncharacterized membrane protein
MISERSLSRLLLGAATLAALLFCIGFVAAPAATASSWSGRLLRLAYRPMCHQELLRCLDLGWGPLAVCARCAGLYLGGALGLALTLAVGRSLRPPPIWLAAAVAPTVIDFGLGLTGLPSLDNWPRFALALPPGLVAGLFVADAIRSLANGNMEHDPVQ